MAQEDTEAAEEAGLTLGSRSSAHYEKHDGKNESNDKQNVGDVNGSPGNSGETKQCRNNGNNKKCNSPSDHDHSPLCLWVMQKTSSFR
jgi:hypothetical protein